MRLLYYDSNEELKWTKDLVDDDTLPPYAILSHTWQDDEEVTFHDLLNGKGKDKAGFDKIRFCAKQAKLDGLCYFWVDTCCIDKSNSVELQYAINSMFRWYQNARQCYAYLVDISFPESKERGSLPKSAWMPSFQESRWFTRGWTLQELLAPRSVKFYSQHGQYLGDKNSLQRQIHQITGIHVLALQGISLGEFSVEDRMSWMKRRQARYKEDEVYSLLGMFDVHMVLNYGEGKENALKRFHKELKESSAGSADVSAVGNVHWIVPRMVNSLFTGRSELLNWIQSALRADQGQNISEQKRLVITGMGGQGKSEICLKVANLMQEDFWGVFWVDVSSQSTATSGFIAAAKALGSSVESVDESLQVLASTKQRWLLILDNADDPAFDYAAYIPSGTRGAILMTSRNSEFGRYSTIKAVELEGLDMQYSSELLLKAAHLPEDMWTTHWAQAQDIVRLLGSHTLALIQAGAYIAKGYCRLDQYAEEYQQQRTQLLKHHPEQEQSRYRDVYATFEASAAVLEHSTGEAGKDALDLLTMLSMLHFSAFPQRVFKDAWTGAKVKMEVMDSNVLNHPRLTRLFRFFQDTRPRTKQPRPIKRSKASVMASIGPQHVSCLPKICSMQIEIWSDSRLRTACALLASLSLVTRHQFDELDWLSMHPLAHAWAKDRLGKEQQKRAWVSAGCCVALSHWQGDTWTIHEKELRPHMQAFLSPEVRNIFSMGSQTLILPIVLDCGWIMNAMREDAALENMLEGIYQELQIVPSKPSKEHLPIWELAASNMRNTGHVQQSVMLWKHIVKVREATLKATDTDLLMSQHDLARAYNDDGEVQKAIRLLEHVVKVRKSTLKEKDPDLLVSQHALASVYADDGQLKKAITILEHVTKVKETTLKEMHPDRLVSQHELARAYRDDGQIKKAIVLLEHVNKVSEDMIETHPDRLVSQHVLAVAYGADGQIKKAIELLEHVVKVRQTTLLDTHYDKLGSQHELAKAYYTDGQTDRAVALLEHVVKIEQAIMAETHPFRRAAESLLAELTNESDR